MALLIAHNLFNKKETTLDTEKDPERRRNLIAPAFPYINRYAGARGYIPYLPKQQPANNTTTNTITGPPGPPKKKLDEIKAGNAEDPTLSIWAHP